MKLQVFVCSVVCVLSMAWSVLACDSCGCTIGDPSRGGGSGITAGIGDYRNLLRNLTLSKRMDDKKNGSPEATLSNGAVPDFTQEKTSGCSDSKLRRWSFDTTFEYRQFQENRPENSYLIVQNGHDQHAYRFDYFINEHIGYVVTEDLAVGVSAGYRALHKLNVDDLARLGQRESSTGATGLTLDAKYRFMRQSDCFPLDLALFASVKTPLGETNNRRPNGELFETEDQPGTGAWNGTLGLAASHGWEKWGVSASASYTFKAEGSQNFKEGNVAHLTLSASRLLSPTCCSWKLYGSAGLQGFIERHAEINGVASPDHGGRFMYVTPGISAKPHDRLVVSLTAPIPVIQDENGTHQKQRWNVQLGVGLRF